MRNLVVFFSILYLWIGCCSLSSKELPKGAKIKKIEFLSKAQNMFDNNTYLEIEGAVQKDTFVVDHPISIIYSKRNLGVERPQTIITGVLRKIGGKLYIEAESDLPLKSERINLKHLVNSDSGKEYYSKGLYGIEIISDNSTIRNILPAKDICDLFILPSVEIYNIENKKGKLLQKAINNPIEEERKYEIEVIVPELKSKLENKDYRIYAYSNCNPVFIYDPSKFFEDFADLTDGILINKTSQSKDLKWIIEFSNGDKYTIEGKESTYLFSNGDMVRGKNGRYSPFRNLIETNKFYWPSNSHNDIDIVFNTGESINETEWNEAIKSIPSDIKDEMQKEYRFPSEYKLGTERIIEEQNKEIAFRNAKYQKMIDALKNKTKSWGSLGAEVSKGNIKIGMTKEMVNTALMISGYYRAKNTNNFFGASQDRGLATDPEKYTLERLYKRVHQTANSETYTLTQMGQFIFGGDFGKLTFTNNKLTSISRLPNRGFY